MRQGIGEQAGLTERDCKKLHKAVDDVLNYVGLGFKQIIYEELQKSGMSLDYPCSSIDDIESALKPTIGSDAASLIGQALRKELKKQ